METPRAEVWAARRLTPRMQAYCVKALRARARRWLGMVKVRGWFVVDELLFV